MAEKTKSKFLLKIKEFFRKMMVKLKRSPQIIALVVLFASFLTYSFNLTKFSYTTTRINVSPMGLCEFVSMLFSILAMVCFLNAFPKRKKIKWVMVGIMFAMMAAIVAVDIVYYIKVDQKITADLAELGKATGTPAAVAAGIAKYNSDNAAYFVTRRVLIAQIILLGISALLVAFLPLYRPLLKKINTSVEVEGNDDMEAIELEADAE